MVVITLKPKEDIRIRQGHPWIYENEIAVVEGIPAPGEEVEVHNARGLPIGYALFNPHSKIRARVFSKTVKHADEAYFIQAFETAKQWRDFNFGTQRMSLRLVYGEADSVPGLIVDGFVGIPIDDDNPEKQIQHQDVQPGLWLVVQFLSLGVDVRKSMILNALHTVFKPDGIIERSDAPVRRLEGLEESTGVLSGSVPNLVCIEENGALFEIDLAGGQKTGWFLDQRANRRAAARYATGQRVLDMFCNQGGFSVLAAKAGAASVLAVDSSADALELLRRNALRNGVADRITTIEANAFDYLRDLEKMGRRFGLIILDPPAFAKNRASLEGARRGYKELNLRAMHLLERGGVLVTCSCSHWVAPQLFDAVLADAAFDSNRRLRLLEERTQDLDHPISSMDGGLTRMVWKRRREAALDQLEADSAAMIKRMEAAANLAEPGKRDLMLTELGNYRTAILNGDLDGVQKALAAYNSHAPATSQAMLEETTREAAARTKGATLGELEAFSDMQGKNGVPGATLGWNNGKLGYRSEAEIKEEGLRLKIAQAQLDKALEDKDTGVKAQTVQLMTVRYGTAREEVAKEQANIASLQSNLNSLQAFVAKDKTAATNKDITAKIADLQGQIAGANVRLDAAKSNLNMEEQQFYELLKDNGLSVPVEIDPVLKIKRGLDQQLATLTSTLKTSPQKSLLSGVTMKNRVANDLRKATKEAFVGHKISQRMYDDSISAIEEWLKGN